jgi:hypothetical protein
MSSPPSSAPLRRPRRRRGARATRRARAARTALHCSCPVERPTHLSPPTRCEPTRCTAWTLRRPVLQGEGQAGGEAKAAITRWRVLERGDGCVRVRLQPATGRTHQLRVHCSLPPPTGLGAPILGDGMYGDPQYAAHSYLDEVAARGGREGALATRRREEEEAARAARTASHGAQALPYLASCTYLDGVSAASISGTRTGLPRLLLHAAELCIPDDMTDWRGRAAGLAALGVGGGSERLMGAIPAAVVAPCGDEWIQDVRERWTPSSPPPPREPVLEDMAVALRPR